MSHPSTYNNDGILTFDQLHQYNNDGYLVLPNFITDDQAITLKQHADTLIDSININTHPMTSFQSVATDRNIDNNNNTIDNSSNKKSTLNDKYFLDSADNISAFFESDALDMNGRLVVDPHVAFNKIGHYIHILDSTYRNLTFNNEIKNIAKSLNFIYPIVLQSMLIFKHPKIGGKVDIHRDSTFLYTEPSNCM